MTFYEISDDELRAQIQLLKDTNGVADLLGMSRGLLDGLANSHNAKAYHTFHIPKKAGGDREIRAPRESLKEVQRRLVRVLSLLYTPPECAFGFIAKRSIVQNAARHCRARWVLNIDLEDFFPSINFGRIRGMLCAPPYSIPLRVATRIAALCCHDGVLPQGAPTSPIVANMLARKLDRKLQNFAALHRLRYSRYADDITFSSLRRRFPDALIVRDGDDKLRVSNVLLGLVDEAGFRLNERKTRLLHYSERQEVTGLVVNTKTVNIPREFVRQVRAMLHAWETHSELAAEAEYRAKYAPAYVRQSSPGLFRQTVLGKLSYLAMVKGRHDPVYVRLVERARSRIDKRYGTKVFLSAPIPADGVAVIASLSAKGETVAQGTGFFLRGVGIVTCYHVIEEGFFFEAFPGHDPLGAARVAVDRQRRDWDLAILTAGYEPKYEFEVGDDSQLRVGTQVRIVGYPNWSENRPLSVTDTVIQGVYSELMGARRFSVRDAIFGGNSGGPVLNEKGQVIGVALTGMFQSGGGTENTFIPVSYVRQLVLQPASV